MMKRKATPKARPSPRSTSTSSQPTSTTTATSNRVRSQSVATRRPTPATTGGKGGSRAAKAATDEDVAPADNLYRIRSFTTRTGVVVNRGDSFKRRGGPRSDGDSDSPVPGPQSGRIHPPPPSSASSVSFAAQQHQQVDSSDPIPLGTGHYVRQFAEPRDSDGGGRGGVGGGGGGEEPRNYSADGLTDPPRPQPPQPTRSRQSLAAAGGYGRKGHYPSGAASDPEAEDSSAPPVYKVLVLGSLGVGKKTLTKQLLSSEYYSSDCNVEERDDETVTVQLDDEESVIQFVDSPGFEIGKSGPGGGGGGGHGAENRFDVRQGSRDFGKMSTCVGGDGFLVVYSVTDRGSFRFAQSCLQELRPAKRHNAVILVANKHDLVRNRLVPETEGIKLATKRHCKFIEVSALLDHRMDELLVGIVRQIRLRQRRNSLRPPDYGSMALEGAKGTGSRLTNTIGSFFQKIFRKDGTTSGKCEDLMAP